MKITISDEALAKQGLTMMDFGILIYYMGGGTEDILPDTTAKLLKKGLVEKTLTGYSFCWGKEASIQKWGKTATLPEEFLELAEKMMELYPKGSKCAGHPWRSNKMTVATKLATLKTKMAVELDAEKVLAATKRYVESFNGNYTYMQCLNYFVLKKDREKEEDTSALLSYLEQGGATDTLHYDSGELI